MMTQAHRLFQIVLMLAALIGAPHVQASDMSPEQHQRYWNRYLDRLLEPGPLVRAQPQRPAIKRDDRLPQSSSPSEGAGLSVKPRDPRPLVPAPASGNG